MFIIGALMMCFLWYLFFGLVLHVLKRKIIAMI